MLLLSSLLPNPVESQTKDEKIFHWNSNLFSLFHLYNTTGLSIGLAFLGHHCIWDSADSVAAHILTWTSLPPAADGYLQVLGFQSWYKLERDQSDLQQDAVMWACEIKMVSWGYWWKGLMEDGWKPLLLTWMSNNSWAWSLIHKESVRTDIQSL